MTVKFSLLCARLVSQFYNFFCRDSDLESPCSFRENVNSSYVFQELGSNFLSLYGRAYCRNFIIVTRKKF